MTRAILIIAGLAGLAALVLICAGPGRSREGSNAARTTTEIEPQANTGSVPRPLPRLNLALPPRIEPATRAAVHPAPRDWHDEAILDESSARDALEAALDDIRLAVTSVARDGAPHPAPRERRALRTSAMRAFLDLAPHLTTPARGALYAELISELSRVDELDGTHPDL